MSSPIRRSPRLSNGSGEPSSTESLRSQGSYTHAIQNMPVFDPMNEIHGFTEPPVESIPQPEVTQTRSGKRRRPVESLEQVSDDSEDSLIKSIRDGSPNPPRDRIRTRLANKRSKPSTEESVSLYIAGCMQHLEDSSKRDQKSREVYMLLGKIPITREKFHEIEREHKACEAAAIYNTSITTMGRMRSFFGYDKWNDKERTGLNRYHKPAEETSKRKRKRDYQRNLH